MLEATIASGAPPRSESNAVNRCATSVGVSDGADPLTGACSGWQMSTVITGAAAGPEFDAGATIATGTPVSRIASASTARIVSHPPESLINAVDLTSPASVLRQKRERPASTSATLILAMPRSSRWASATGTQDALPVVIRPIG